MPMTKRMICIECPKGCELTVEIDGGVVGQVSGNRCPKGIGYARDEVARPARVLTSTVTARGLAVAMVPVRTDRPIPKSRLAEAMRELRRITVTAPVNVGDVIAADFLGLGADLVATRRCGRV